MTAVDAYSKLLRSQLGLPSNAGLGSALLGRLHMLLPGRRPAGQGMLVTLKKAVIFCDRHNTVAFQYRDDCKFRRRLHPVSESQKSISASISAGCASIRIGRDVCRFVSHVNLQSIATTGSRSSRLSKFSPAPRECAR